MLGICCLFCLKLRIQRNFCLKGSASLVRVSHLKGQQSRNTEPVSRRGSAVRGFHCKGFHSCCAIATGVLRSLHFCQHVPEISRQVFVSFLSLPFCFSHFMHCINKTRNIIFCSPW